MDAAVKNLEIEEKDMEEFDKFKRQQRQLEYQNYLHKIEHTNLSQFATAKDIKNLCQDAITYKLYGVCVQPSYLRKVFHILKNYTQIKIITRLDFPIGENTLPVKVFAMKEAFADGADEIDIMLSLSAIKNNDYAYLKKQMKKLVQVAKNKVVKFICNLDILEAGELQKFYLLAKDCKVPFITLHTASYSNTKIMDAIMKLNEMSDEKCKIKVDANIQSAAQMKACILAGADRVAISSTLPVLAELKNTL